MIWNRTIISPWYLVFNKFIFLGRNSVINSINTDHLKWIMFKLIIRPGEVASCDYLVQHGLSPFRCSHLSLNQTLELISNCINIEGSKTRTLLNMWWPSDQRKLVPAPVTGLSQILQSGNCSLTPDNGKFIC